MVAGSGEFGPRKRYGHYHSLCCAYVPLPVRHPGHLTLSTVRRRQDWRAQACCDRAHLFSINATTSEDQEASPFFLRHRKGNICHRAYPAPCPTEAKRAGNFFLLSPFWSPRSEERSRLFRIYRRLKPPRRSARRTRASRPSATLCPLGLSSQGGGGGHALEHYCPDTREEW